MTQNKTLKTASILGALALMIGGVVAVDAASGRNTLNNQSLNGSALHERGGMMRGAGLSEDERDIRREEMEANHEAVEEAISENNFEKWQAAIGENNPFAEKITADNFSEFAQIHKSMETNRDKLVEMGIDMGDRGFGMGRGMGRGQGQGDCPMLNN